MTDNRWFVRITLIFGLVLLGLVPAVASAQDATTVSGQVKASVGGAPLVGVIISAPALRLTVQTDNEGRYRLVVPAGTTGPVTLTARRIGYQNASVQVSVSGGPVEQDITLQEGAIELTQVVVTALGIEREQRSLSYSAQTVSGDRLTNVPTQNVVSALQGNVAGVQVTNSANPFGSARIVVRGASSILGQNQPLIIIDGIPIDNSAASNDGYGGGSLGGYDVGNAAADLNADNIASVTVLKGPNAAALYGSRAANGAIVYTTKSGKGAPQQGFGVTGTFGANMETPLRLPNYQNKYGQGFYGEFDFVDGNFSGVNDGADESWGPKLDGRTTGCIYVTDSLGNPDYLAGYNTAHPCNQFFGAGPWQAHPNNVRDFWNNGLIINANVAVARSSATSNVRLSVGRTNESGMYPNNTNNRTDIALSGGTQVSDHWSAEASVNYIRDGMQNQPSQAYEEIDPMQGFIWFGRQVDTRLLKQSLYRDPNDPLTIQILKGTTTRSPYLRRDAPLPYSWNYSYHPSPYWMSDVKKTDYSRNRGLGHAAVSYKVNDWISVTGRTGRDWYQNQFRANYPVNDISPYSQGGFLDVGETRSETNNDFLVTGNRSLTPTLSLTVNAGGNQRINDFNTNIGQVGELVIPGVYTLANSNGAPGVGLFVSHKKVNSLYGSANFNFKDWLNLDITGRNDWSSTLPKGANSLFYPSIGAAFVFTDALKLQNSFLSYGKVRASWTRVGNDTDPYQLEAVYGAGTAWAGQPSFTAPDRLPNARLKPEQTTGEEIGADLGFLHDKLILNATIYQKATTNQILPVSISAATGYGSAVVNSGEVRNRGLEIAATMTPIDKPDFRWNVVVNWSKNSNKVLSLYGGVSRIVVGSYWNVNVTADSGQPYGNLVGYKWQRDAQGHTVVGSDGLPLRDPTQQVLGNYNPDWVGGISNTISYKRFSFSFSFDGQMGGQVYSVTKWFGQYSGVLAATLLGRENNWNDSMVVANSVYSNGQPNTTKVLAQDYWHNTFYAQEPGIFDATYFKLREARLGYQLPASVAKFLGFSDANVAIVGKNLMLFARQPTIDPETAFDTSNRQGVENGQLPTARSIGFTMSVRP